MATRSVGVVLGYFVISLAGFGPQSACSSHGAPPGPEELDHIVAKVQSPQIPITGSAIPQFAQQLPLLSTAGGTIDTRFAVGPLDIHMCEFDASVLPPGTFAPGIQPRTRVWGYRVGACPSNGAGDPAQDTYVGPVLVSERRVPTDVSWHNGLGSTATTSVLAYRNSTDQTLFWADPNNNQGNPCALAGGVPAFGSVCAQNYAGSIPAVTHLHGGEVPPQIDGGPEAWFTSDGAHQGPSYYSLAGAPPNGARYRYPNSQEAAPLFFHDHTLGTTRLTVHAGLAGAYFIEDPSIVPEGSTTAKGTAGTCRGGCLPPNLQSLTQAVPLVLQARSFDTNGQLFFPADSAGGTLANPNPQHPYWAPEFLGDVIVVNGKAWPYLNVEAKRYRFVLVNGSNARAYDLSIPSGPPMYVIATDGGYLDAPVAVSSLVMMPGERYEVIMDFAGLTGKNLILRNSSKAPLPHGAPPQGATLGQVLQFRVGAPPLGGDVSYNPAAAPRVPLRSNTNAIVRLVNPATGSLAINVNRTRQLTLNEVLLPPSKAIDPVTGAPTSYPGGPLMILLNNSGYLGNPRQDFTPVTRGGTTKFFSEQPQEGDTELWEIVNLTADAHPIHLHLVQFQLMNRQRFNSGKYTTTYNAAFAGSGYVPELGPPLSYSPSAASGGTFGGNPDVKPFLQGSVQPPTPYEAGWKDTVIAYPGEVTRFVVRWAPQDLATTALPPALHYPFDPSNSRGYVWHCHIIDHEDNDMMRPYAVTPNPASGARSLVEGVDY